MFPVLATVLYSFIKRAEDLSIVEPEKGWVSSWVGCLVMASQVVKMSRDTDKFYIPRGQD